jgi:hypothetical protein
MAEEKAQTSATLKKLLEVIQEEYELESEEDAKVVLGALLASSYGEDCEEFFTDVEEELQENEEDYF